MSWVCRLDLPADLAHAACAYEQVFILEGKKEKKALSGVVQVIKDEIVQHYPPGGVTQTHA